MDVLIWDADTIWEAIVDYLSLSTRSDSESLKDITDALVDRYSWQDIHATVNRMVFDGVLTDRGGYLFLND